ncbi:hypothetical protein JZ751_022587 [Albula glossodonta]|uniref:Uncharacterized protein n=1 Tax=Albula glossodonta TaxID=121402 RepID=A0A8T2PGP1_9TELE|nr:hypothetical protein JZ751_022587 [Albula glossodonta]
MTLLCPPRLASLLFTLCCTFRKLSHDALSTALPTFPTGVGESICNAVEELRREGDRRLGGHTPTKGAESGGGRLTDRQTD